MGNLLEFRRLFRDFPIILEWPKYFVLLRFPLNFPADLGHISHAERGAPLFVVEKWKMVCWSDLSSWQAAALATVWGDFERNVWLLKVFGFGV